MCAFNSVNIYSKNPASSVYKNLRMRV